MDKWWKKAIFYEIYMPSYCDSNGDGIGDFKGIISKLDYLKELGVDAIWITPFYKSPKIDNGYDIEDYLMVDSDYGTNEDIKSFIDEAHKRKIKVIIDMVLNHTSDKHAWFLESKKSLNNPKRNWYIWLEGKDNGYPNNWESFFGGSAWEYDKVTNQYYYHAFSKEQVDLNWNNEEVKKAMFEIVEYWLKLGIDGLRLDVINFLKTDCIYKDNPYGQNGEQLHIYDKDKAGILEVIKELRQLVNKYGDIFLLGEVGSEELDILMKYVGEELLDAVFNFNLGSIQNFEVEKIYNQLSNMYKKYKHKDFTLFFGSHDMPRYVSRFSNGYLDEEKAKLIATLIFTAKGIPFIYYGDEIGMKDFYPKSVNEIRDIQALIKYENSIKEGKQESEALELASKVNRDKSRTPMQWDGSEYCSFSKTKPWINIPSENKYINVEEQSLNSNSILNYYKKIISLRKKNNILQYGEIKLIDKLDDVIYYIRSFENKQIMVLLNFSNQNRQIDVIKSDVVNVLLSSRRDCVEWCEKLIILPYEALIIEIR